MRDRDFARMHNEYLDPDRHQDYGPEMQNCTWYQDDEESETWWTICGHGFDIIDGGPILNEMWFCCFCGKSLTEVSWFDRLDIGAGQEKQNPSR